MLSVATKKFSNFHEISSLHSTSKANILCKYSARIFFIWFFLILPCYENSLLSSFIKRTVSSISFNSNIENFFSFPAHRANHRGILSAFLSKGFLFKTFLWQIKNFQEILFPGTKIWIERYKGYLTYLNDPLAVTNLIKRTLLLINLNTVECLIT